MITEVMKTAGDNIAALLYDATIEHALGDGVNFEGVSEHDAKLVKAYIAEEISSAEAIYLAMEHARQEDNRRWRDS